VEARILSLGDPTIYLRASPPFALVASFNRSMFGARRPQPPPPAPPFLFSSFRGPTPHTRATYKPSRTRGRSFASSDSELTTAIGYARRLRAAFFFLAGLLGPPPPFSRGIFFLVPTEAPIVVLVSSASRPLPGTLE
jgi:hypothetical protein